MDPITLSLLITGCAALVVLAGSLLFGGLSHELSHDLGHDAGSELGDHDGDGPFSLPAIAAFIGGFGFFGAIAHYLVGSGHGAVALLVTGIGGLAGAQLTATFAIRLSRALARMPTDATLTADDLLAASGVVVTPIGDGTFGEVRVVVGGQPLKLYAKSDHALPLGTNVFVVEALTESSVVVVRTD